MHTIDQWFQAWTETDKYRSLSMNPFFSVLSLFFLFLSDSLACSLFTSKGLDTKLPDSQSDCLSFPLTLLSSSFSTSLVYWGHRSGREADRTRGRERESPLTENREKVLQKEKTGWILVQRKSWETRSRTRSGRKNWSSKKETTITSSDTRKEMLKPLSREYYISRSTQDAKVNSRCSFFAAAVST